MAARRETEDTLVINGQLTTIKLIDGLLIDDVLNAEARIQAHSLLTKADQSERRVSRGIREYLIRTGVEQ